MFGTSSRQALKESETQAQEHKGAHGYLLSPSLLPSSTPTTPSESSLPRLPGSPCALYPGLQFWVLLSADTSVLGLGSIHGAWFLVQEPVMLRQMDWLRFRW